MSQDYDVVMNFDVHAPDRGMLTVVAHPTRPAPPLTAVTGGLKAKATRERNGGFVSCLDRCRERLQAGPCTIQELMGATQRTEWSVRHALTKLRDEGLQERAKSHVGGRKSFWISRT